MAVSNKRLLKSLNRSLVLNAIKKFSPVSRADLARKLGLSPATVTSITAEMISDKLIFEKAAGSSSGGRPPVLLAINPQAGFAVGIKLTENEVIAALTDLEAKLVSKTSLPWDVHEPEKAAAVIRQAILTMTTEAHISWKQILGVGIGLAGVVDARSGTLRYSPYLPWKDLNLRDILESALNLPVFIDNDVNTLTLAEKWFGSGQGVKNFIVVTLGRGIGMGMVINGQLEHGYHGGAGELGHIIIEKGGLTCSCGHKGCLEAYINDQALLQKAIQNYKKLGRDLSDLSLDEFAKRALAGEAPAVAVVDYEAELLGKTLANLLNIIDPEQIIIGGEGMRVGDLLLQKLPGKMQPYLIPAIGTDYRLLRETLGDDAWARGAASLVLKEMFESPIHKEDKTSF